MVSMESPISGMSDISRMYEVTRLVCLTCLVFRWPVVVILGYCRHQSQVAVSEIHLVVILGYCMHLMHAEHENRGVGQW